MKDRKVNIKINKELCKGCMLCLMACPRKAIQLSGKVNSRGQQYVAMGSPEKCTGCGMCYLMCPDCAIEIMENETKDKENGS